MPADRLRPSREASATRLAVVAVVVLGAVPLVAAGAPGLLPGGPDPIQTQAQQQQQSTPLEVDPERADRTVRPGNSTTITVTLANDGDAAVALNTSVVELEEAPETVPAEWITVEAPDRVAAGESATATVTVDVPAEAESGRSFVGIAFTNVTDERARPVGYDDALFLSLEVSRPPTVFVRSEEFLRGQVRAGQSFTRTVVVENTGEAAVSVDPSIVSEDGTASGPGRRGTLPDQWVTIDAPAEIGPGETARINFTVAPPANATPGRYDVEYTLGIDDPARPDEERSWQRVDLSVGVWQVPEEPITRTFEVRPGDDTVTVTLSASADERPDFEVALVSPSGTRYELEPASVRKEGGVDLVEADAERGRDAGPRYEITYTFAPVESGEWTLAILPENTPRFGWEVVTGDEDR